MIEESGGRFIAPQNLINPGSLEYALAIVSSRTFSPYSSLFEKAAALAYHIIAGHVFVDGNKRTGLFVAWEFLHLNGTHVDIGQADQLAVDVAAGRAGIPEVASWLTNHIQK